ncbi:alpha-1,6-mannosyltransferase subunit [Bombardia bombarda]|uniref:Mannosyltransferase n=1 Tax=Bombardia bombarda TaxID=252184 RepID=A0AA40BYD3_9PEZI|nr:alpha-1,6-mannosyltransferase subunit [Bombardia bombarda]
MRLLDIVLSLLIPGLVLVHLVIAPYTKVEESFNIQATHDVLVYGTPTTNVHQKLSRGYDHFTFPGVVPRTFIGPVLLAGIAQPIIAVVGFDHAQLIVRAILGLFNAACLLVLSRNIRRTYGITTARWYLLLQASQFHIIFYASRTLPNMFAFGLILPRQRLAIAMFVFAAAVFRSEVALLLAVTVLHLLLIPATSLERVIPPFLVSFLMALLISVPIDSYFWQKPLWPELWGFYYNAVLGSSSNWGVSPWHYYFSSALPRLFVNPLVWMLLIPLSLRHPALAGGARRLVVPPLLFVAIYSLQPHKEARFIFYAVPPLTAAAALGANLLFNRRGKGVIAGGLAFALVGSVALSFAASSGMLLLSALNYPGGEALAFLRETVLQSEALAAGSGSSSSSVLVPAHADVLSCMTGVTLFGTATGSAAPVLRATGGGLPTTRDFVNRQQRQMGNGGGVTLVLDKTEDEALLAQDGFWRRFDYVLAEDPAKVKGGDWDVLGVVQGLKGVELLVRPDQQGGNNVVIDDKGPVVGRGAVVARWKRRVRALTGGRWVGPSIVPRIYILKRVKDGEKARKTVEA